MDSESPRKGGCHSTQGCPSPLSCIALDDALMRSATKTRPRTNDCDDRVSTAWVSMNSSDKRQHYIREIFDNVFTEDDVCALFCP
ncbi:unnamed protein product [Phytophthora fragariaefolia]|uniref:Unnamed protein product n=1 Tax=Phytophthora fragariaefolia TaxID=1490495 RepID=A0A9W6Y6S6_9STRA|nr:unnamed protein product [Phytophthora fragariaefolia]